MNDTSTLSNPIHIYDNEGTYCITLISSTTAGCIDTAKNCLDIISPGSIFIPNVFSPNGDGHNDVFVVTCVNISELHGTIYDRWGLKMGSWDSTTGGWPGTSNTGAKAPDGTYYYIIDAKAHNGKEFHEQGYLQLIR